MEYQRTGHPSPKKGGRPNPGNVRVRRTEPIGSRELNPMRDRRGDTTMATTNEERGAWLLKYGKMVDSPEFQALEREVDRSNVFNVLKVLVKR